MKRDHCQTADEVFDSTLEPGNVETSAAAELLHRAPERVLERAKIASHNQCRPQMPGGFFGPIGRQIEIELFEM